MFHIVTFVSHFARFFAQHSINTTTCISLVVSWSIKNFFSITGTFFSYSQVHVSLENLQVAISKSWQFASLPNDLSLLWYFWSPFCILNGFKRVKGFSWCAHTFSTIRLWPITGIEDLYHSCSHLWATARETPNDDGSFVASFGFNRFWISE